MNQQLITAADSSRKQRLYDLAGIAFSNREQKLDLRWPDHDTVQRAALNDWTNDGPRTLLTLAGQLRQHSAIVRAGASVTTVTEFLDVIAPNISRTLEASWGDNTADIGSEPISAVASRPKRLSAFINVSDRLRHQSPLLTGQWLEAQLLSAMGVALDKAALVGTGDDSQPLGLLNDDEILTHERTTADVDTLDDLAGMEEAIANSHGEADPGNFCWIVDPATRRALRSSEGAGGPLWPSNTLGPLGHRLEASPHAPAGTVVLAQAEKITVMDWNRLTVENLVNREQALEGFRTLLVSGWFDVIVSDPRAVCVAINPA
jgi:HK97 family phage major capsid protein